MPRGEPAEEEVNLRVRDDARGFTATVRVASVVEETADGAVLTIEAEGFPEDLGTP
jgi:hypothetical protein